MIYWGKGKVAEIYEETEDIQIIKAIQGKEKFRAIHYLKFGRPLELGDMVILNQTATKLKLGTGGYDFVVFPYNENSEGIKEQQETEGHIMKLRYTPYQFSVLSCEENTSPYHSKFVEPKFLDGLPVIVGELHSMLPTFITILRGLENAEKLSPRKIVYIMTDGGSLPIALSNHVKQLKNKKWLDYTITIGHSFGGDLEAINIYTGLLAAKYVFKADLVLVIMGPGIVGTGTWLGHTGVEIGEVINAVNILQGDPISIIRASDTDQRSRHSGISHHTMTVLQFISLTSSTVPFPSWLESQYPELLNILKAQISKKHNLVPVEVNDEIIKVMIECYSESIKTMGREIQDDSLFLGFIASTSIYVHNLLKLRGN